MPPEFQVNTTTTSDQSARPLPSLPAAKQSIGMDANGNFVVVWSSFGQDEDGWGVYAQRYNAAGERIGSTEFRVNTSIDGDQLIPSVAMARDTGEFVVTWTSQFQDSSEDPNAVYVQRYTADGTPIGDEFRANIALGGPQDSSVVAMDADGDFVVVWTTALDLRDAGGDAIIARRYTKATNTWSAEILVNQVTPGNQRDASVAMDRNGNFVVAWVNESDSNIRARLFRADGTAGDEFIVNSVTAGNQDEVSVAMNPNSNFVVVWSSPDGSDLGISAQLYNADGSIRRSEFRVNPFTFGPQRNPTVAMDANGGFVVTWSSLGQDSSSSWGIFAQRFDRDGNPLGVTQLNDTTASDQQYSSVAMDANGNFVAVWESNNPSNPSESQDGDGAGISGKLTTSIANQLPTVIAFDKSVPEDATLTFLGADFDAAFTDPDGSGIPSRIRITDLPDQGTLRLNGQSVILNQEILFSDLGNLEYRPNPNYNGPDSFGWNGSDGFSFATTGATVNITVTPVNDPPTISGIGDQSIDEDQVANITFTVNDIDTDLNLLTIGATSSNTALLPNENITFGVVSGGGETRRITLTPVQDAFGPTVITLTVSDGGSQPTIATFVLGVNNVNDGPTISAIEDVTVDEDAPIGAIAFTIGDIDTPLEQLTVTATSSNGGLIPDTNIQITGTGADRQITLASLENQSGTARITVRVSDGGPDIAEEFFDVTIRALNDPPSIGVIPNQNIEEGNSTGPISLLIGDAETPDALLVDFAIEGASNPALLPPGSVVLTGEGTNRVLTITPALNQSGTAVIRVNVSDGENTASRTFTLNVGEVNSLPTISPIGNRSTPEETPTESIAFSINDIETPPEALIVTVTSSNETLIPNANIALSGTGADRQLVLTPLPDQIGDTTITVTVADGTGGTTTQQFVVSVTAVDDSPVISPIASRIIEEDGSTGAITFTISDADTPIEQLAVTATSDNPGLIPSPIVVASGEGGTRSIVLTPLPNQFGTANITISVSDGREPTTQPFVLTVTPANDIPTISPIDNRPINEGESTGPIAFTIGDVETLPEDLIVRVESGNTTLIPAENVVLEGSGADRTITITPAPNQSGIGSITIFVSDGTIETARTFNVLVDAVDTAPIVSDIPDQETQEDEPLGVINFTVDDLDTPPNDLIITVTSDTDQLIPNDRISLGGEGNNRTLTITPLPEQSGTATITLSVSDGTSTNSQSFEVVVQSVDDRPTVITPIPDQNIGEDGTTGPIDLIIGDIDTLPDQITITVETNNPDLVPVERVSIGGSGFNRTVTITPVPDRSGEALIKLNISDGTETVTQEFRVIVAPQNDLPTISDVGDQITDEGIPKTIAVTVGDAETPLELLTVTASSDNPDLIPDEAIQITAGAGGERIVTLSPVPVGGGTATITLTVRDSEGGESRDSFVVTVNAVNDAPSIEEIAPQSTREDTATGAIAFTLSDEETPEALTVTATSSDPTLIPAENIVIDGTGINRTVVLTPALNRVGTATITLTVSDGDKTFDRLFEITVTPEPDAPTISEIGDQVTSEGRATEAIAFTIGDVDGDALTITATSSNQGVVPDGNIQVQGEGANRTVVVTPLPNQPGTVRITLTVSDGTTPVSESFDLRIDPFNDTPTIAPIDNQSTNEDTSKAITIALNDVDSPPESLTVTGSSDKPTLIPNGNVVVTGTGAERTVTLTPALDQFGDATITLTVSDGNTSSTQTFSIRVEPQDDAPIISTIEDQVTQEGQATGAIAFTIGDVDGDALTVSATSSNQGVVPDGNIQVQEEGANRTVVVTPLPNQPGTVRITLTVSDGRTPVSESFDLRIDPFNDTPTIAPIDNQSTNEDTSKAITIALNDVDSPPESLTVTGSSDKPTLIPNGNVVVTGTGAERTVTLTPALDQFGDATITLTVSDGNSSSTQTFSIRVEPQEDAPTLSAIPAQSTAEGVAKTVTFTVNDVDTDVTALVVTATSGNEALVPTGNIQITGTGAERTITLTPLPNQPGTVPITLTVSEGGRSTSQTFNLAIEPFNDAPTIAPIDNQSTNEDTSKTIAITLTDIDSSVDSLIVTGSSSNPTLIPNGNVVITGTGATRTVTITPALNQFGDATITLTVSDGFASSTQTFDIQVVSQEDAPIISHIDNQTVEDGVEQAIAFTVFDPETPDTLTVSAISNNQILIPNSAIRIEGTGANRTLFLTPVTNQAGTATITLSVSDGNTTTDRTFEVVVNVVNDPPTISEIEEQTTPEDRATEAIAFTIGDQETPNALTVTATSSNTTLVSNGNIALGGTGANRTIVLTPAPEQAGRTTITIAVSDGVNTTLRTFDLVVPVVDDAPTISTIPAQSIREGISTEAIPFIIGDVDTAIDALVVSATSNNPDLIPNGNLIINGSGANRTITVTPVEDRAGTAIITLAVNDGATTTTRDFTVVVNAINDAPTITIVNDQQIDEDGATGAIAFTIADVDSALDSLIVTTISNNPALIPNGNISLGGTGADRTITLTPLANQFGTAVITINVSDGTATTSRSFNLTVIGVNDPPSLTAITDQVLTEDTATGAIGFSIGDVETPATALTLTATASNLGLFPNGSIAIGGTGASRTLTLTPAPNQSGNAIISLAVSDGVATTTRTFNVTVNPVNDAPTVATTATPLIYAEGAESVPIDAGLLIVDPDSPTLQGATITILNFNDSQDGIGFTDQNGITGSINGNILTLSGEASLDAYLAALRSVTYNNNSATPTTVDRIAQISVRDAGNGVSNLASRTIQITTTDTAPVITPSDPTPLPYPGGGRPVMIDPGITVNDSDSALLTGATVTIIGYDPAAQERLEFITQNDIRGSFNTLTGILTLSGLSALANYQNALRSVTYSNRGNNSTPISRTIQFAITDNSSISPPVARQIQIGVANDAPAVTTTRGVIPYSVDLGAIALDSALLVQDADTPNLVGGAIAIVGYVPGQDSLGFTSQNGIQGNFNSNTGILTLTGSASVSAYQTALRSITYRHSNPTPTTPPRFIQFSTNDGSLSSALAAATLQVVFNNAAPFLDLNGTDAGIDFVATGTMGIAARVVDVDLSIVDADSATLSSATVILADPVPSMQEQLFINTGGTEITATYNGGSGILSLTGVAPITTYQEVLRSVTYSSAAIGTNAMTRTLSFTVNDGTSSSTSATTTLHLTSAVASGTRNGSLVTTPAIDVINAPGSNDTVTSILANLQQNDTVNGGDGIDTLVLVDGTGSAVVDVRSTTNQVSGIVPIGTTITNFERFDFSGFTGSVTMTGRDRQEDTLIAGSGNDVLDGRSGSDLLTGGLGDDLYRVDNLQDAVIEAANGGIDTVEASINFTLGNHVENLTLIGSATIGIGNPLNNRITGNTLRNTLLGSSGDDTLTGNGNRDRLVGGLGNDILIGGTGRDRLTGNRGRDTFLYTSRRDGVDIITDFNAPDDTIAFSRSGFNRRLRRGTLRSSQFTLGSSAGDRSDRIIYDQTTGALFFDADGTGNAAQIQLARLTNRPTLTRADFVIIA